MAPRAATTTGGDRLPYLDGVRGFAALWVVVHHSVELTGGHVPIISRGYLAVDLFMILSGFLMTFHYRLREEREPWESAQTWFTFWTRRYFRIAPLFYALLAVALACGPWLGGWRDQIAAAFPRSATLADRYLDRSPENIISHVTFMFGAIPRRSFSTPLPDWSIGLEMQFYAAFPFLMLIMRRIGGIAAAALLAALCLTLQAGFPDYFARFPMPSMLALKLDLFVSGMLLAVALQRPNAGALTAVAVILPVIEAMRPGHALDTVMRMMLVAAMAVLVQHRRLLTLPVVGRAIGATIRLLDSRVGRFLGDTSYGVYLLHLLLLLPIAGLLGSYPAFVALGAGQRFAIAFAIAVVPVYGGGWLLFHLIERPGIAFGRAIIALARGTARRRPAV